MSGITSQQAWEDLKEQFRRQARKEKDIVLTEGLTDVWLQRGSKTVHAHWDTETLELSIKTEETPPGLLIDMPPERPNTTWILKDMKEKE